MTIQRLFIAPKRTVDVYAFDATHSEEHTSEVEITSHPVELGAEVTDHAVVKPEMLTIIGEVTDTPLSIRQNENGEITFAANDMFGASTNESKTRSIVAVEAFKALKNERALINVQTGLELYSDMIIKSVSVTQDVDTAKTAMITLVLQQLLIVATETLDANETRLVRSQLSTSGGTRAQAASTERAGRKDLELLTESEGASFFRQIEAFLGADFIQ